MIWPSFRFLIFWRKCPYHRYKGLLCFCDVRKGEYS